MAQEHIRIKADVLFYDEVEEIIEASGRIQLSWKDFTLSTDHVRFLIPTLEVLADTPFEAFFGAQKVRGEMLYYSFTRQEGWVENATLSYLLRGKGELLFRGRHLLYEQGIWQGKDILCTGCKREPPLVSLRAKEVKIFPKGKIIIEGLALYIREKKIFEIPWYTRTLEKERGFLLPKLGFSRTKGWYAGLRYEYTLSPEVLFLARYTVGSRGGNELKSDLVFEEQRFRGQIFWDTRFSGKDTWGIAASLTSGDFSILLLNIYNEEVNTHRLSRSPQFIASWDKSLSEHLSLSGKLSYGYFATETSADTRTDTRLALSFEGTTLDATVFGWGTIFGNGESLTRIGGEVSWEKNLSPNFWTRFAWRFVKGECSPFFFDPAPESMASLEFLLGNEEQSFLRVRGRYDLLENAWEDWTFGIGIGNEKMALGIEGVYSSSEQSWQEKRYFLRHRIEDCVDVEVSFWDPEGSFFLALNFVGFDEPYRAESLFKEDEPFDPLSFKREMDTP